MEDDKTHNHHINREIKHGEYKFNAPLLLRGDFCCRLPSYY